MFSRVKVDFNLSKDNSSVSGFFIYEKSKYSIDVLKEFAIIEEKRYQLYRKDFYITETDIYINTDLYDKLFGIDINFDFKQLKAFLSSKVKLPAVLEFERNILRNGKENNPENTTKADYIIPREEVPWFRCNGLGIVLHTFFTEI